MKYVKKPIVIEAMKFEYTQEGITALKAFCGEALGDINKNRNFNSLGEAQILTLEDGSNHYKVTHIATEGDYIIKGIQGEFYAYKPDIFLATHSPIVG